MTDEDDDDDDDISIHERMMKAGHELQLKKRYCKNICEFHTDLE